MTHSLKITFRIVKSHLNIKAMTALLVIVVILSGSCKSKSEQQAGTGETLRFVFMADCRGKSTTDQVNYPALNAIIAQIGTLSPKPSFVMFGGDMSYSGYINNSYTFQAWKDLFLPLTGNGISLFTVLGNHELYLSSSDSGFHLGNQLAFQQVFSENPGNGPPGYQYLTYSFTSPGGNSFFAVLDAYYITHSFKDSTEGGNIDSTQMSWLKAQVAQTKATHKFFFIHSPYYYVTNDPEEPSAANKSYTELWSFLDANKFDMYACGHSHLYSRKTIDSSVLPNPQTTPPTPAWKNNVVQLLNGTSGTKPETTPVDPAIRVLWNVHNDTVTYYFSVIDISGGTVTVNSYRGGTGAYTVFDTFTINR
ncbi:MAG: metallophosphoesterase [Bacteroidota bacterium]